MSDLAGDIKNTLEQINGFLVIIMTIAGAIFSPAAISRIKRWVVEYFQIRKQVRSLWVEKTFDLRSEIYHSMNNYVNILPECHKMLVIKVHNGGDEIMATSPAYTSVIFETFYMSEHDIDENGNMFTSDAERSKSQIISEAWQGVFLDATQNAQIRQMTENKGKFLKVARSDLKDGLNYKQAFYTYNVGCVYHSHCYTKQGDPRKSFVHSKEDKLSKVFYVSFLFEDEKYVASQRDLGIMREANDKISKLLKEDLQYS